jgi:hypothetical protein
MGNKQTFSSYLKHLDKDFNRYYDKDLLKKYLDEVKNIENIKFENIPLLLWAVKRFPMKVSQKINTGNQR